MSLIQRNGLLEDLAGEIGLNGTLVLVAHFADQSLYIPATLVGDHPICRLLGKSRFAKLVREFGSSNISIPSLSDFDRMRRNRLIADLLRHSIEVELIAAIVGLTSAQIRNVERELVEVGLLDAPWRRRAQPSGRANRA